MFIWIRWSLVVAFWSWFAVSSAQEIAGVLPGPISIAGVSAIPPQECLNYAQKNGLACRIGIPISKGLHKCNCCPQGMKISGIQCIETDPSNNQVAQETQPQSGSVSTPNPAPSTNTPPAAPSQPNTQQFQTYSEAQVTNLNKSAAQEFQQKIIEKGGDPSALSKEKLGVGIEAVKSKKFEQTETAFNAVLAEYREETNDEQSNQIQLGLNEEPKLSSVEQYFKSEFELDQAEINFDQATQKYVEDTQRLYEEQQSLDAYYQDENEITALHREVLAGEKDDVDQRLSELRNGEENLRAKDATYDETIEVVRDEYQQAKLDNDPERQGELLDEALYRLNKQHSPEDSTGPQRKFRHERRLEEEAQLQARSSELGEKVKRIDQDSAERTEQYNEESYNISKERADSFSEHEAAYEAREEAAANQEKHREQFEADFSKHQERGREQARENGGEKNYTRLGPDSKDHCKHSDFISSEINGEDYSCDDTIDDIERTQTLDLITTAVGSVTTQAAGQINSQRALQSGSQAETFEGAATTARIAGYASATKGTLNLIQGFQMLNAENKHKKNAANIENNTRRANALKAVGDDILVAGERGKGYAKTERGYIEGQNAVAKRVVEGYQLNKRMYGIKTQISEEDRADADLYHQKLAKRRGEYEIKHELIGEEVEKIGNKASSEQEKVKKRAKKAKFQQILQSVGSLIQSASQFIAADQLDKTADNLREAERPVARINFESDPLAPNDQNSGVNNPSVNPPAAQAPAVSDFEDEESQRPVSLGQGPELTGPEGPVDPNGIDIAGRTANSGGSAGTSPANISTGNTPQTASGSEGEARPTPASAGAGARYGSGGGRSGEAYRGGRNGDQNSEKDFDLSQIANLFQQQQKDAQARNGIVNFEEANRGIASQRGSLLGKNVNLFKRVSQAYRFRQRQGEL